MHLLALGRLAFWPWWLEIYTPLWSSSRNSGGNREDYRSVGYLLRRPILFCREEEKKKRSENLKEKGNSHAIVKASMVMY